MKFFPILFTVFFASPCQAYLIPRADFYLGIGAGGERIAPEDTTNKGSVVFDMGLCFGIYKGRKGSPLTGLFTLNIQLRGGGFILWETYAAGAIGARTKLGYFSVDLFGIGLSINRVKQSKRSRYWDGIELPKKNGPDPSVNLGLLLVLPGGFQYDGGENNFFTLGLRFMLNLKLHDGVAQTALEAGARTYRDVLWKVSLRVSFTVGINFMSFVPK